MRPLRTVLLLLVELLFVASIVAGVALIYVPAAFIVAGVLGVVAVEWNTRDRGGETQ